MNKFLISILILLIGNYITAQNEKVTIQIPNKSDLIYNGKTLQILNPNLVIGQSAGLELKVGALQNTIIGNESGKNMLEGRGNTFLGYQSGQTNNGSDNIFIGNQAGLNEMGSNLLYISNNSSSSPLIYGDFSTKSLTINNNLEIKELLKVNGDATFSNLTGTGEADVFIDENGSIFRKEIPNQTFNFYDFYEPEEFPNFKKFTKGVHFENGITLSGIGAYILDNEPGSNTAVTNMVFVILKRKNKTDDSLPAQEIYRIESTNTATDSYTYQTTNFALPGYNVIDNSMYIYYLEIFSCDSCNFTEVTFL